MNNYILDENDCPRLVTREEYCKWHQSLPQETRTGLGFTLAKTERGGVCVSTVFLGSNHGWDGGPPVLWETMVFCDGEADQDCERATSRREAMQIHEQFCQKYLPATV